MDGLNIPHQWITGLNFRRDTDVLSLPKKPRTVNFQSSYFRLTDGKARVRY